jgi:hypothetical protein
MDEYDDFDTLAEMTMFPWLDMDCEPEPDENL